MENKWLRSVLIAFVAVVLVVCAFGGGFAAGHFIPIGAQPALTTSGVPATPTNGSQANTGTPANLQNLFSPFWEAWNLVHQNYVDQPVDDTKLMQGAINGMMNSLGDAHTLYMDPQQYKDANSEMSGNYQGIGAWVDTTGQYLTITSPMKGSPAEKAGLQPGDQITAVDGVDMTGTSPELVRLKVLGPAGSTVKLTVLRQGVAQPFDVEVIRAQITVPSVTSKMLDNNIGYIQLTVFGDTSAKDFHDQLAALMAKNPKGLVLDLRDNGGGLLDAAISIASEFIDHGDIVSEKYGDGHIVPHPATSGGLALKIPLVVLVNKNTASASEIVSGAIQDDGRGKLVGTVTYGKGTVQNWIPLSGDQGAVAITIARWLTPNGNTIDKKGLTPDVAVTMTADDVKAGRDPQLDAAVKLLTTP